MTAALGVGDPPHTTALFNMLLHLQVVGMTASLGVGDARAGDDAAQFVLLVYKETPPPSESPTLPHTTVLFNMLLYSYYR